MPFFADDRDAKIIAKCLLPVRSGLPSHLPFCQLCSAFSIYHITRTSHKQHLALLLDCPYAWLLLVVVFFGNVYRFFDVAEDEVAM
jgi:hypothetical protein